MDEEQGFSVEYMRFTEFKKIIVLYNNLSQGSKLFFHPIFVNKKVSRRSRIFERFIIKLSTQKAYRKISRMLKIIPSYIFIVYKDLNSKIIGFSYLRLKFNGKIKGFVGNLGIAVSEKFRGYGIGKILMNKLIEEGKKSKVKCIQLTTLENNKKAISLYKRNGFIEDQNYKGKEIWEGQEYNDIRMLLEL